MFDSKDSSDMGGGNSKPLVDVYDEILVPLIFDPYASDMTRRLADMRRGSILEIAAGTGAVTRALAAALPAEVSITATDLVQPTLDRAIRVGTARPVTWQQADVFSLPFEDDAFDAVVCQFGAMFFDPKAEAFAEVHRVLRPGGTFVFSVWDSLDDNEFAATVAAAVKEAFPEDPPTFVERVPHGYHDRDEILADVRAGGFTTPPEVDRLAFQRRGESAEVVATAYCAGTPMRVEIAPRGPESLSEAIAASAIALAKRFGSRDLDGRISAQVVTAIK